MNGDGLSCSSCSNGSDVVQQVLPPNGPSTAAIHDLPEHDEESDHSSHTCLDASPAQKAIQPEASMPMYSADSSVKVSAEEIPIKDSWHTADTTDGSSISPPPGLARLSQHATVPGVTRVFPTGHSGTDPPTEATFLEDHACTVHAGIPLEQQVVAEHDTILQGMMITTHNEVYVTATVDDGIHVKRRRCLCIGMAIAVAIIAVVAGLL